MEESENEIPESIWSKLTKEDKTAYIQLKEKFHSLPNKASKVQSSIQDIINYTETRESGYEDRCMATGLVGTENYFIFNTTLLTKLLGINAQTLAHAFDFTNYVKLSKNKNQYVLKHLPSLASTPSELKHWSLRIPTQEAEEQFKSKLFPKDPNLVIEFEKYNRFNIELNKEDATAYVELQKNCRIFNYGDIPAWENFYYNLQKIIDFVENRKEDFEKRCLTVGIVPIAGNLILTNTSVLVNTIQESQPRINRFFLEMDYISITKTRFVSKYIDEYLPSISSKPSETRHWTIKTSGDGRVFFDTIFGKEKLDYIKEDDRNDRNALLAVPEEIRNHLSEEDKKEYTQLIKMADTKKRFSKSNQKFFVSTIQNMINYTESRSEGYEYRCLAAGIAAKGKYIIYNMNMAGQILDMSRHVIQQQFGELKYNSSLTALEKKEIIGQILPSIISDKSSLRKWTVREPTAETTVLFETKFADEKIEINKESIIVPDVIWVKLSKEDKKGYLELKEKNRNKGISQIFERLQSFISKFQEVINYTESESNGYEYKCLASGLMVSEYYIIFNSKLFNSLINLSDGSTLVSLLDMGYYEVMHNEKKEILTKVFSSLNLDSTLMKGWSVRAPSAETTIKFNTKFSKNLGLTVPENIWNMLSEEDRTLFYQMKMKFSQHACKNRLDFFTDFQEIINYTEMKEEGYEYRCLATGVIAMGDLIIIHKAPLVFLLGIGRRKMNNFFEEIDYNKFKSNKNNKKILFHFPQISRKDINCWRVRRHTGKSEFMFKSRFEDVQLKIMESQISESDYEESEAEYETDVTPMPISAFLAETNDELVDTGSIFEEDIYTPPEMLGKDRGCIEWVPFPL